jgi:hypothetical protein
VAIGLLVITHSLHRPGLALLLLLTMIAVGRVAPLIIRRRAR